MYHCVVYIRVRYVVSLCCLYQELCILLIKSVDVFLPCLQNYHHPCFYCCHVPSELLLRNTGLGIQLNLCKMATLKKTKKWFSRLIIA